MLMSLLLASLSLACDEVSVADVATVDVPSILVLGERHGHVGDLRHAADVVRALMDRGPVTVSLEAVAEEYQDVLDQLSRGEIRARRVKRLTRWSETWGHAFSAYRPLLRIRGLQFVAGGPPLGKKPADVEVPVPESYAERLESVAVAHGMSADDAPRFAASMAYRDRRIGELAVNGWDGSGVLVIVTGRGHVAQGLGTPWQLAQGLSDADVSSALLARGKDCGPGDRHLPEP
ncbi:MAG: ChaN family lipoprotein [Myxococcales bacterium]|nr:ChaN family lipoprotein [Myxococcales bacterium]